jgi:oligoendopeptidase F
MAKLWSRLHQEYWGVSVKPEEADWDVEHYLMAPVYVENYAIGILMVEQLYRSMVDQFKPNVLRPELGEKLRKVYFAPGEEFDYLQLTEKFSGKPLTAKDALGLIE